MATFTLPELGENVASATVSRVLVAVGDTVGREQSVLELETDKATVEVPSAVAGVVTAIRVAVGDKLRVGDAVLEVAGDGAGSGADAAIGATAVAASAGAAPPATPDAVAPSTHAVPSSKVVPMPRAAALRVVDERGPRMPRSPARANARVVASPAVRRLARELGVDPADVPPSAPGDRVTQGDVKAHARALARQAEQAPVAAVSAPPLPDFSRWGEVERVPMSGVRRATADHLSRAWTLIPHVTQCEKADVTDIEALRKQYAAQVKAQGGALTMTAILVKVLGLAVQRFPQFNASIDMEASAIIHKRYVNVGVAVDTDRGLLVPVVRHVDQKTLTEIAVEVPTLAAKARDKKLTLDDMSGGGISLSNLGGIGGTHFTPIVNWPEVAILGVSRGVIEPVHRHGAFEPRLMLPLSLSYDHRAIDGADGMRFLRFIVDTLEQPFLLAL